MKKKKPPVLGFVLILVYALCALASFGLDFGPGKAVAGNAYRFLLDMLSILPCTFIWIGLFEVWVRQDVVEKQMGRGAGVRGYIWAVVLSSTAIGGLYVALPVACALLRKGAGMSIVLTYLGAATICRVPMVAFEATFMGLKFTLIRLLVSLPLVILSSMALGRYLTRVEYRPAEGLA